MFVRVLLVSNVLVSSARATAMALTWEAGSPAACTTRAATQTRDSTYFVLAASMRPKDFAAVPCRTAASSCRAQALHQWHFPGCRTKHSAQKEQPLNPYGTHNHKSSFESSGLSLPFDGVRAFAPPQRVRNAKAAQRSCAADRKAPSRSKRSSRDNE